MVGTNTARLNLYKPNPADNVDVNQDINANYDKIDLAVPIQQSLEAPATGDATLTTSAADVPGASITFNTTSANAVALITVEWDWRLTATGTGYCYGEFAIDGATDARKALFVAQSAETRLTGFLQKRAVLVAPGSHTIKLQCHKDIAAGTAIFCRDTTVLSINLVQ